MSSQERVGPVQWHFATDMDGGDFHGRSLLSIFAFLAVFVVISFIVLYSRWACGNHHHDHAPPPSARPPAIGKSLPIILHQSAAVGEVECCICLGEVEDGDKVKEFPVCKHLFHSDCLDRWLARHFTCPLCRTSLDGALLSVFIE